jgi:hypothetical protein
MKRKHGVPIYGTPAAKANAFQLCFVPAFTGALQYSAPFGLGYRRQDSNYHFSHFPVSAYPVINKPDGHPLGVKFLYQLDHIGSVTAQAVQFLNQNGIAFLHLHAQQIKPRPIDGTAGCLIGKDTVSFHACIFECPDLNIKGLLTG